MAAYQVMIQLHLRFAAAANRHGQVELIFVRLKFGFDNDKSGVHELYLPLEWPIRQHDGSMQVYHESEPRG